MLNAVIVSSEFIQDCTGPNSMVLMGSCVGINNLDTSILTKNDTNSISTIGYDLKLINRDND